MKVEAGQNAILTGASRGLGTYVARTLAARGVNLVLAARSTAPLESLAQELSSTGIKTHVVTMDMSQEEDVNRLYEESKSVLGDIDYVINNAGIEIIRDYTNLPVADIRQVLDVNLTGPMLLSRLALQDMYERDSGHIVNIASAAGKFPPPFSETYSTTKSGLIAFSQSVRLSARLSGKKVSATAIAPGDMDDAGMYEDMKEVADTAPWYIGSLPAQAMADAVIKAIEKDRPVHILMPWSPKLLKVTQVIAPKLFETISLKMGIFDTLITLAQHRDAQN